MRDVMEEKFIHWPKSSQYNVKKKKREKSLRVASIYMCALADNRNKQYKCIFNCLSSLFYILLYIHATFVCKYRGVYPVFRLIFFFFASF